MPGTAEKKSNETVTRSSFFCLVGFLTSSSTTRLYRPAIHTDFISIYRFFTL